MRLALAFAAGIAAGPALADYSDHHGVTIFTDEKCGAVMNAIDGEAPKPSETDLALTGVMGAVEKFTEWMATYGMTWGFILGFDTAHGGLEGSEETTLIRLRKACAETPDATAIELLRGFTQTAAPRPRDEPTADP